MKLGRTQLTIKSLMHRNWLETEMRTTLIETKSDQYAQEMADGDRFPDPVVFIDPKTETYRVGDGFHRIWAYKKNHCKLIWVDLKRGGFLEAVCYNIQANKEQKGLPFSVGDKSRCVETLLHQCKDWTYTQIAEIVGCSVSMVSIVAKKLDYQGEYEKPDYTTDRNGRTFRLRHKKDRFQTAERRQKVLTLTQQGKSQWEISRELEMSRSTIQRDLDEALAEQSLVKCPHCKGTGYVQR